MENYSVLMSVYYKEKPEYLRESIQSMLDQTVPTNDFVIVCDGPLTQDLDAEIGSFCQRNPELFQIIQLKENQGLGKALNVGIGYCRNELIARMDSDDVSCPERCQKQLAMFALKELDIVSGTIQEFSEKIAKKGVLRRLPTEHKQIMQFAKRRCPFNHPCVMYRKQAVYTADGYKSTYKLCEDYDLWIRMLNSGARAANIDDVLLYMRVDNGMYRRRGGFDYLKSMLRFRAYMYHLHFSNLLDFLVSAGGQIVLCTLPESLRKRIYQRLLRRQT